MIDKTGGFSKVNESDIIVTSQENGEIYGVFGKIEVNSRKAKHMSEKYYFTKVHDLVLDMDGLWDINDAKCFCEDVNKWTKRFGITQDFKNFEPDSRNQRYFDF